MSDCCCSIALVAADPPKIEEIIAVTARPGIVVLWRAGLRIQEALALAEGDLDHGRGALLVRRGKGGRRREVGMDAWGWDELQPWLELRVELPVGPVFCVLNGRTRGRQWPSAGARTDLRRTAVAAGVRRTVRSTSAPARSRQRNGPRRRTARRHPAPVRPQQPRHGPRPPRAHDPGQHGTSALTDTRPPTRLVAQSSRGGRPLL
jgi:integrase